MLKFDAATHTYTFNGHVVPGVTSLLEPLSQYQKVPWQILKAAAERGNYVHKCCEMYLWGTLDEEALEPEILPYVEAFKRFLNETEFQAEHVEERVFHEKLRYAGTLDLAGTFPKLWRRRKPHFAQVDIKTTFKLMKAVGPQTFAYSEAWASQGRRSFEARYALQLKKDGTYALEPLTDDTADRNAFMSCLNIYNFMR